MADTIACPACGEGNGADRKFCGECGSPEAREIFERLEAAPWLERCGRIGHAEPVSA
jgi:hypothetical protein